MWKSFNLFVILVFFISFPAFGTDYWVDVNRGLDTNTGLSNDSPFKTITHALTRIEQNEEDPVTLLIAPGTYSILSGESFPMFIKSFITIKGFILPPEQDEAEIVIDGAESDTYMFNCSSQKSVTFSHITVSGGGNDASYGGAIHIYNSVGVTVENCVIKDNTGDLGGGLYVGFSDDITITDTVFSNNRAAYGGGLLSFYAPPKLTNCSFEDNWVEVTNTETGYGGIGGGINFENSYPDINNCEFTGNRAVDGGAIQLTATYPNIYSCSFSSNYAEVYEDKGGTGGAISCDSHSNPVIYGCSFTENWGVWGGGMFCAQRSEPVIDDCYFGNNQVAGGSGGGLYAYSASPKITNTHFSSNWTESFEGEGGYGGGLFLDSCTPELSDCTFDYNRAEFGAGLALTTTSVEIKSCMIFGNYAEGQTEEDGFGGGLHIDNSSGVSIINCMIADNSAYQGGGIFCRTTSPRINNATITANDADAGDGIYVYDESMPILLNCIVWDDSIFGTVDVDYSNIQGGHEGEGNINEDPLFVQGPQGDYYLSQKSSGQASDSPCVNAGTTWKINIGFNPFAYTTRTDGIFDRDITDMGYHHQPHVKFDLHISPEQQLAFSDGDTIDILFDVASPANDSVICDIYFVMVDPSVMVYFGLGWSEAAGAVINKITLPPGLAIGYAQLLELTLPNTTPPVSGAGLYTFAIGATIPGTLDFISNIPTVSFDVR